MIEPQRGSTNISRLPKIHRLCERINETCGLEINFRLRISGCQGVHVGQDEVAGKRGLPSMRPEARKYLYGIQHAGGLILEFTDGKTFADYEGDAMLRLGNEARRFSLNQMGDCPKGNPWIAYFESTVRPSFIGKTL